MKGPRIDRVEIADFRGIPAGGFGPLLLGGENLLLFGENGSGKSSIFHALADLLDLSRDARPFDANLADARCLKHRFSDPALITGCVTLHFTQPAKNELAAGPMHWRIGGTRPIDHPYFRSMARIRGCLDYRAMLRTSFVHEEADGVNLFPLLIGTLLCDIEERALGKTFGEEWQEILASASALPAVPLLPSDAPSDDFSQVMDAEEGEPENDDWTEEKARPASLRRAIVIANRQRAILDERITVLNEALKARLPEIEERANSILSGFRSGVKIQLHYDTPLAGPEWSGNPLWHTTARLHLRATYREEVLEHPATFLNEARLSAIALAIYLAALQLAAPKPQSGVAEFPRLLVLDDVLLGIDMANRMPVLDLIQNDFAEWQVLLLTHDRVWYEIARQRLPNKLWQHYDLFSVRIGDYEQPLLCEDRSHLARARTFLGLDEVPAGTVREPCDVKAAAAHVRTQFELTLRRGCERLKVKIAFHPQPRKMGAKTFWNALKDHRIRLTGKDAKALRHGVIAKIPPEAQTVALVPPDLVQAIEHLDWVLNPLVHSESAPRFRQEVEDGIAAVEALETRIKQAIEAPGA